jgi:hypothetical protein
MSVRALPAPADDTSAHRRPAVTSRPALPAAAPPADPVRPTARRPRSRVIAAAGDIACDPAGRSFHGGRGSANACHMRATARLLGKLHPAVVLTLGDNQYENGTLAKFRQFVVGTGGKTHYGFRTIRRNSRVRNSGTFGVLRLTLHPSGYDWRFVPEPGKAFTDTGHGTCHRAATRVSARPSVPGRS